MPEERPRESAGFPWLAHGIRDADWGHLVLSEKDHRLIRTKRGEHNRLGYAVQLTVVRYQGRFETDIDRIPDDVVLRVADQLDTSDPLPAIRQYGGNRETVWAHRREIAEKDGWTVFADAEPRLVEQLETWLETSTDGPKALALQAVPWLHRQKVLLPTYAALHELVVSVHNRAEDVLLDALYRKLTPSQTDTVNSLLQVPKGETQSKLARLRRGVGAPTQANFEKALDRVDEIDSLGFAGVDVSDVFPRKLTWLARRAMTKRVDRLKGQHGVRAAVLAAVKSLERTALDDAIDLLDKLITERLIVKPRRWADKALAEKFPQFGPAGVLAAEALVAVLGLVEELVDPETGEITDPETDTASVRAALEAVADRDTLAAAAKNFLEHMPTRDSDTDEARRAKAVEQYPAVRKIVATLVDRVPLDATRTGQPVLTALRALPQLLDRKDATLQDIDIRLLKGSWGKLVRTSPAQTEGPVNLQAYAVCVLETFHQQLCKREIYVRGCIRWGDLRAALLTDDAWAQTRPGTLSVLNLPGAADTYLDQAREDLHADLTRVASRLPEGSQVVLANGNLHLLKSPASRTSPLSRRVDAMLPKVQLPDVLLNILNRTGTAAFTTPQGGTSPHTEFQLSLAAVMVGVGCNLGLAAVAGDKAALDATYLDMISRNYFRPETIEAFNKIMQTEQAALLGSTLSDSMQLASVDGHRFTLINGTAQLPIAPKGSTEVTWLTLLTEQAIQLSGRLVSGRPSAALEALDSLISHQRTSSTSIPGHPHTIVAEAGKHEDLVFGLLSLCGYSYQPTPSQMADTKLWRIDTAADYGPLQDATRRHVDVALIAEKWDDILRVAGSIHHGVVSAHTALQVLTHNGAPTRLGAAIVAIGRIAKSRHLLSLYDDPDYRHGIEAQSRLHTDRHQLARRIFHGIDGPQPEYQPGLEDQLDVLGLVLNIVAHFNTIYIIKIVEKLRSQGKAASDSEIRQLSLLRYRHINMRGRFHFEVPSESTFDIADPQPDSTITAAIRPKPQGR